MPFQLVRSDGRPVPVDPAGLTLGRRDLPRPDKRCSSVQVRVVPHSAGMEVTTVGHNPCLVRGADGMEHVLRPGKSHVLHEGDILQLLRFVAETEFRVVGLPASCPLPQPSTPPTGTLLRVTSATSTSSSSSSSATSSSSASSDATDMSASDKDGDDDYPDPDRPSSSSAAKRSSGRPRQPTGPKAKRRSPTDDLFDRLEQEEAAAAMREAARPVREQIAAACGVPCLPPSPSAALVR
eukprot:EG_transcript_27309